MKDYLVQLNIFNYIEKKISFKKSIVLYIIILILMSSFTSIFSSQTIQEDESNLLSENNSTPTLNLPYPHNESAIYNPILSININNSSNGNITIIFRSNATGSWKTLGTYIGGNGEYTQCTNGMDDKNQRYYWSVNISNGNSWTNQTYNFIAQPFVLKWTRDTSASTTIGPLAIDINGDGIYNVYATGKDLVTCLNGSTGELIWEYTTAGAPGMISSHAPFELRDLNNDGIPELVIAT
ncbi:MAG: hypothetical protein QCI00_09110, partial [Candidatus Thermoplasmatota archaeon]|nr:hypothetical protein [Candidatus Thermoplasmatota archaeon]